MFGESTAQVFESAEPAQVTAGAFVMMPGHSDTRSVSKTESGILAHEGSAATVFAGIVEAMVEVVAARDPYTADHQMKVARIAEVIADRLGLNEQTRRAIYLGASIHDIGKIAIPSEVLSYPGRLSFVQQELVRTHSRIGHDMVAQIPFPWPLADIVCQHHERFDGSGYPRGLSGYRICLEARVVAIADVVDAISSERPYCPALGIQTANNEIRAGQGGAYDPDIAQAYLSRQVQRQTAEILNLSL